MFLRKLSISHVETIEMQLWIVHFLHANAKPLFFLKKKKKNSRVEESSNSWFHLTADCHALSSTLMRSRRIWTCSNFHESRREFSLVWHADNIEIKHHVIYGKRQLAVNCVYFSSNTVWREIFAGSNFREFSKTIQKLDPAKINSCEKKFRVHLLHLFRLVNSN